MAPDADVLPVLVALRVKGRGGAAELAGVTGLAEAAVARVLADAVARGVVKAVVRGAGFALTAVGRDELGRDLAAAPCDRAALATVYEARFLPLDARLKAAVSAWQTEEREAAVPPLLVTLAADARDAASALAAVVGRYATYAARLDRTRAALARGERAFVASPRVDSLHQVWFELHEDLLVTLGRERHA